MIQTKRTSSNATFETWMQAVNDAVGSILFGMSSEDLPDVCYREMYDDGMSATTAAKSAIRNAQD